MQAGDRCGGKKPTLANGEKRGRIKIQKSEWGSHIVKRVFLVVLDSFGVGAAPDAAAFGDAGTNTLAACAATGVLSVPHMVSLGLGDIDGVTVLPRADVQTGACVRLQELSKGKDTTIGHWEIAGLISEEPLPTYPHGFPDEVVDAFSRATGRGVLCNLPYSGTEVIADYGEEHLKTGKLIVYTSADSVFQIAAHEELVPPETLYEYCRMARKILTGKHAVGRVIARPFVGAPGHFTRTANRHDFSLEAPGATLLDMVSGAGQSVIAVGKISDIFAGRGVTSARFTHSNAEGMAEMLRAVREDFRGLCFVNLVDYDMLYGHRRDPVGYARALNAFDDFLPSFLSEMREGDVLMITADHGCDPSYTKTTDHTREFTPLLVAGAGVRPGSLGTRQGFSHIAATVADLLGVPYSGAGESLKREILL